MKVFSPVSDSGNFSFNNMVAQYPYNAPARPWYVQAVASRGLVSLSDPYIYTSGVVGCTVSFAIFKDLLPPGYAVALGGVEWFQPSNEVELVVAIDIQLDALSRFLQNARTQVLKEMVC